MTPDWCIVPEFAAGPALRLVPILTGVALAPGTIAGRVGWGVGVMVAGDGTVYMVDSVNNRVQAFCVRQS